MVTSDFYEQLRKSLRGWFLKWNPATRLAGACVLAVLVTALFLTATVIWSAYKIDNREVKRQASMVYHTIQAYTKKLAYDQQSVVIWDDAIENIKTEFNRDWIENNIGSWMPEYFQHDRTYLIRADGAVLYANFNGQTQQSIDLPQKIKQLSVELRRKIAAGALKSYEAGKGAFPTRIACAMLDGQPAIISIAPIISDTGKSQPAGSEAMMASVRFFDAKLVKTLAESHKLKNARTMASPDVGPDEAFVPIMDDKGRVMTYLAWLPTHPGYHLMSEIMAVWLVGLLAIGMVVTFLARAIREAYLRLAESEAKAQHAALHDVMTGLPNRQYFNERLAGSLKKAKQPVSLLLLDLDRFKQVNDTMGHRAGDELICELAARLKSLLRPEDFLARVGGDEFVVIAEGDDSQGEIDALSSAISLAANKPFTIQQRRTSIGISIGIATSTSAHGDLVQITRQADLALYRAKNAGRNRIQFFTDEMGDSLRDRHVLEAELRTALETGSQLEVYYQPVYCARTMRAEGVEALVRWNHPRLGQVAPLDFITIAEESGLIDKLGYHVLRTACHESRGWNINTVAVNVSPLQILKADFVDNVLSILESAKMHPSQLELEITEGTLLDQSGFAEAMLKRLRDEGVKIALDDFGTGYSSLSYLVTHKVDRVKIDRSFVQKMGRGSHADPVVLSIVTMAHSVGLQVTAEGVETEEQKSLLKMIGCDVLQGYHFSRPIPAEQAELLLRTEAAGITAQPA